ncbi:18 kDa learning-associated protein of slug-like [Mizuhopecten yessoensis]|uniref:18 kDa learning-associated protein of slug n=1 Tax=Mizuhopecten yessoensis TaxID=6573 RepID=A0A210PDX6_MIZYE|nr:18 kDa learning-associated protein of slug-like [Mizuhopecten yessoensis]OWF34672.1 18 kDa learning-associated protein of slug [Mizuhopecten yessoensis]
MAKSLRCKFRKRMRNVKREKYGKKELERLKTMIETSGGQDQEVKEIYKVKTAEELKEEMEKKAEDTMEHSGKSFHPVTLKDEDGHYPGWMNQRAIKRHKTYLKKSGRVKTKPKAKGKTGKKK